MSNYGVFSGLYLPVFSSDTGKYGPEKTPYLDTFHAGFTTSTSLAPHLLVLGLLKLNLNHLSVKTDLRG